MPYDAGFAIQLRRSSDAPFERWKFATGSTARALRNVVR